MAKFALSSLWQLPALMLLLGCQAGSNAADGGDRPKRSNETTSGAASGSGATTGGSAASGSGATTSGNRASGSGGTSSGSGGASGSAGTSQQPVGGAGSLEAGSGGARPGQAGASGTAGLGGDVIVTIKNGDYWQDTAGHRIEAHGAGVIRVGDTWYWIGEDKSANSANFKAVNCYASRDLSHWEFRHAIITPRTSTDLAAADRIIERPKVIYNQSTKKYVMWLHWEGKSYATSEAGVFTSGEVDGDYEQVRHFQPNKRMSRDDTLFKDDDGKAYFLSASNNNADLSLYELSDDYTDMKRQISTLWAGSYREAPALMKADGHYFIVSSGATNWDSNQQKFATATSIEGPWSALANLGDATGFDTQTAFIIPVQGTKTTTYIYAGDRWQDPDLKSSKYIWLPLEISGANKLVLKFYASWQLNVTTGEWNPG
jgi:hypothetical protein